MPMLAPGPDEVPHSENNNQRLLIIYQPDSLG
jgi:hypothetical protein